LAKGKLSAVQIEMLLAISRNFTPTGPMRQKQDPNIDGCLSRLLDLVVQNPSLIDDEFLKLLVVATPRLTASLSASLFRRIVQQSADWKLLPEQRLKLLETIALCLPDKVPQEAREYLMNQLRTDLELPTEGRSRIYILLAKHLTTTEFIQMTRLMKTSPYRLNLELAQALANDNFGADLLLTTIKAGEAPTRLLQEPAVLEKLKSAKVKDLDTKIKELTKGLPAPEKRIDDLLKARVAGYAKAKTDVTKGQAVFKNSCAACHQMNSEGGKVGPQLDGIGIRGLDRLVEDTLDPSRNVDHVFRQTRLDLADGSLVLGLLLREDGGNYIMANDQGKEVPIRKVDVEKRTTNNISAMPNNIDTTIPEADYYHLLRYLLEQRAK
jgi:putative heme-binding domain-containing protein